MAVSLTARRLKTEFDRAIATNVLGGSDVLGTLARIAAQCQQEVGGPAIVVVSTLRSLFSDAEHDYSDRPVAPAESTEILNVIHQPIQEAIEYLVSNDDDPVIAMRVCENLIATQMKAMPIK